MRGHKIIQKLAVFAVVVAGLFGVLFPSGQVSALSVSDCQKPLLTFRPWFQGLVDVQTVDSKQICVIKSPSENELSGFIWTIVTNVLADLFMAVGYVAGGFIIYGGVMYMLARGDTGRIEKAKKTLVNALIGLVIALLASGIVGLISNIIAESV